MPYQICTRCIMDTSDPAISFDTKGYCNHCTTALRRMADEYLPNAKGQNNISNMVARLRQDGQGGKYDCILGLSGGVDSSYLAWKSREWGLRILLFHVDGGWNTEESTHNVQTLAERLGYDLHIHTIDWEEMRDVQVAYLKSGLSNLDVPQDHAFFAVLFKKCEEYGIRHWLSGMNLVSESILPASWGHPGLDGRQLVAVHDKFGKHPLRTFPVISFWDCARFYGKIPFFSRIHVHTPLNNMPYDVFTARKTLENECGWKDYGQKHEESRFTKLFQNHILPQRFGYDKKRAHYSSLIVAGIMTRDEAMEAMQHSAYTPETLENDISYVCELLGLTHAEWDSLMRAPKRYWQDYPSWGFYINLARKIKQLLRCWKKR
ncbi:MAG: N-acetyl sugar amidotransferase [Desulfovibrio sp.]|nr:N-acetyl sugar amidotransferase [Desulfovibrio sp.]